MHIQQKQKKEIEKAVKRRGVRFATLFGSRANGKTRQGSDLDIAVLDEQKETHQRYGDLFNDFSKIFKGHNVDLRMIKGSEPVFLYNTLMKGKFLGGNKQDFYNYRAFAYKNYVDSKPLFELKTKLLLKRQKLLNQTIKNVR
ncbi:nucleotidyltransferase domain-containing protein [Candidatus Parcubacteria bacterium]|nr:nucleotidyltransferase domain-containing protein [Candidatus Parcubacteria bacterium]